MDHEYIANRNRDIVERFLSGQTYAQIGRKYELTRERVRQILKKKGYTRWDGGSYLTACKRNQQIEHERELACRERTGLSRRDKKRIAGSAGHKGSPYQSFTEQRNNALHRGIEWNLTFAAWWYLWCLYGHYDDRGRGMGKYVMARYGDTGPYSLTNCKIILMSENSSEQYENRRNNPST